MIINLPAKHALDKITPRIEELSKVLEQYKQDELQEKEKLKKDQKELEDKCHKIGMLDYESICEEFTSVRIEKESYTKWWSSATYYRNAEKEYLDINGIVDKIFRDFGVHVEIEALNSASRRTHYHYEPIKKFIWKGNYYLIKILKQRLCNTCILELEYQYSMIQLKVLSDMSCLKDILDKVEDVIEEYGYEERIGFSAKEVDLLGGITSTEGRINERLTHKI